MQDTIDDVNLIFYFHNLKFLLEVLISSFFTWLVGVRNKEDHMIKYLFIPALL